MAQILLLETSASVLSVALAKDGTVVCERVCTELRQQAALTAPLVKEVLQEAGVTLKDCDAVAVSSGPGSYTGLRVGVSTAKGLSFGANLPLIAVPTLDILVAGAPAGEDAKFLVPMLDARRMEVYSAVYSSAHERLTPIEAVVVGEDSFASWLEQGPVLFLGDGALKCKPVLSSANARFLECQPLARHMAALAEASFQAGRFENLAYFEPYYLKDFVATVSKKALW